MTKTKQPSQNQYFPAGQLPMREMSKSLPIALLRARESIMGDFRSLLHEYDLTDQQWRVLRALAESLEVEVVGLADRCVILQPSVSRIVKKLEDRGLISRRNSSSDRRRSHITMTAKGRDLFQSIAPRAELAYEVIIDRFGSKKLTQLLDLLDDLSQAMTGNMG